MYLVKYVGTSNRLMRDNDLDTYTDAIKYINYVCDMFEDIHPIDFRVIYTCVDTEVYDDVKG